MDILGIFWGYLGDTLGKSWGYLKNVLGLSWGYLGDILGISGRYPGEKMIQDFGSLSKMFHISPKRSLMDLR